MLKHGMVWSHEVNDLKSCVWRVYLLIVLLLYFYKWLCGSFMFLFCLMFAMSLCASVDMCFVVTCWERADLLALVCGV